MANGMSRFTQYCTSLFGYDRGFFVFIFISIVVVYSFSWGNEFISDDIAGIALNPSLGNFWMQAATTNINNIVYSAIYSVFGPIPFWFHINNTIAHLATTFLVYACVQLIGRNRQITRLATILFALHPIETEGVTWISGYPYTIYTFFSLAALLIFVLVDKHLVNRKWIFATPFLFLLALRSSEKAIVVPGIFVAYLIFFSSWSLKKWHLLIPTALVGIVYVTFLFFNLFKRIEYVNPSYMGAEPVVYNPLDQIPTAIGTYVQLMLLPYNLTLYHEFLFYSPVVYGISVFLTLLVIGSIIWFWKRLPLVSFGLSLFLISLSPTLLPVNIAWIVAERYVHLGSVGFFIAVSALFYAFVKKIRLPEETIVMTISVLVLVLGGLTIKRNLEWRSQDTLWPVTVKVSPYSAYAHNNMGDYYGRHGDIQNSILSFEKARKLRPRYPEATHNLGNVYEAIGEATKAAELYQEALTYNPMQYQSYQKLGSVMYTLGNSEQTEAAFIKSAAINPDPFQDYVSLVILYGKTGQTEKQQQAFTKAQSYAGNDPQKMMLLQKILYETK